MENKAFGISVRLLRLSFIEKSACFAIPSAILLFILFTSSSAKKIPKYDSYDTYNDKSEIKYHKIWAFSITVKYHILYFALTFSNKNKPFKKRSYWLENEEQY